MKGIIPLSRFITKKYIESENNYLQALSQRLENDDQSVVNNVKNEIESELRSLPKLWSSRKISTVNGLIKLIQLYGGKIEDKELANYLLSLLNVNASELEEDDIIAVLNMFVLTPHNYAIVTQPLLLSENNAINAKNEAFLLSFLDNYPDLVKHLSSIILQRFAKLSPKIAIKIFSQPLLKEKLYAVDGCIIEIFETYQNDLAFSFYASDYVSDRQLYPNHIPAYFAINDRVKAHENVMVYVGQIAYLRVQFNQAHLITMFAALKNLREFIQLFNCLIHTQDALDNLLIVLHKAARSFDPDNIVKDLPLIASFEERAYAKIQHYLYVEKLLLKHESEHGYKYLTHYPTIAHAIYNSWPEQFAVHLYSISFLTLTDRVRLLNANRTWLTFEHLLLLNMHMTESAERKTYFMDGDKDADKSPADKIREGIKREGPLNGITRVLVLAALEKNDLRNWIDLARDPNLIIALLNKTVLIMEDGYSLPTYDDKVSQIIALDPMLIASIRGESKVIKYGTEAYTRFEEQYGSRNDFLFAANFVLAHIASSGYWFQRGRNEDFINAFINYFLNIEPKLPTTLTVDFESLTQNRKQAMCWFIANHKDLNTLLHEKTVRKKSYFSLIGFGPSDEEIKNDQMRLSAVSEYLMEEKLSAVPSEEVDTSTNNEDALRPHTADNVSASEISVSVVHTGEETTAQQGVSTGDYVATQAEYPISLAALAADMSAIERIERVQQSNPISLQNTTASTTTLTDSTMDLLLPPRIEISHDAQPATTTVTTAIPSTSVTHQLITNSCGSDNQSNDDALGATKDSTESSQNSNTVQSSTLRTPSPHRSGNEMQVNAVSAASASQNSHKRVARDLRGDFEKAAKENKTDDVLPAESALHSAAAAASISVAPAMSTIFKPAPPAAPPAPKNVKPAAANSDQANNGRKSLFDQINALRSDDGNLTLQLKPTNARMDNIHPRAASRTDSTPEQNTSVLATMATSSMLSNFQPQSPNSNNQGYSPGWSEPSTPIRSPVRTAVIQPVLSSAAASAVPAAPNPTEIAEEKPDDNMVPSMAAESNESEEMPADAVAVDSSANSSLADNQALLFSRLTARRNVLQTPPETPQKNSGNPQSTPSSPW